MGSMRIAVLNHGRLEQFDTPVAPLSSVPITTPAVTVPSPK